MNKVYTLTLKSATRDPFLLLWSIIVPVIGTIALGYFVKIADYPAQIVTGMMATGIIFYSFMTTSHINLLQRRRGVFSLLKITPMSLWRYIISISNGWTTIAIACGLLVLSFGVIFFGLNISFVSILAMIVVMLPTSMSYVFLSFIVSSFSKNESYLSIFTSLITYPLLFCSNAFYSLDNAPYLLRTISRYNPFERFVSALRNAMNLNWIDYFLTGLFLLITFFVLLLISVRTFKHQD